MLFGFEPKRPREGGSRRNAFNFTEDVRRALARAREESVRLRHDYVGTEHILLALLHAGDSPAVQLLADLGVDRGQVRAHLERSVKHGSSTQTLHGELPYTSRAKKILELAMTAAREGRSDYVGAEHLLLGVLREEKGIAAQILGVFGVTHARMLAAMQGEASSTFEIRIDDKSDVSIYEQIVARIQEGIATGALRPGERIPTVRRLADDLDIAPGTVARAYGELERLGVVVTEGTRGTRVAPRVPPGLSSSDRPQTLTGLLRPVVVAGYHLGASAEELRAALEGAMQDIFRERPPA
ncbi:MAG TPA: Clp protease N-terminal domain-containing protein [Gemmatimonadaceae bacterium]|nr:Clp protease N-terminal domain-containing protein [Gemmatimonadaceae bacterium]